MHPIITNEMNEAFFNSSFINITMATNTGMVNNGCPMVDMRNAIFCFIFSIQKFCV
jgi:hypothetical protein